MKPFGECPTCGGVLFEGHGDGKRAHLSGLKAEDYEKLEAEVAQLRADGQRLREVLVRAGEMVTFVGHGATWEIAPSIQERARETETLVVAALAVGDAP